MSRAHDNDHLPWAGAFSKEQKLPTFALENEAADLGVGAKDNR